MCKQPFFTPLINSFGEQTNWLSNVVPNQVWGMCVSVHVCVCCAVTFMLRVDSLGMPGGSLRLARGDTTLRVVSEAIIGDVLADASNDADASKHFRENT